MTQEIELKLKDLRGVLGSKADKLKLLYYFETDSQAKRVVESQIHLLHAKHFTDEEIKLLPPPAHISSGDYPLGMVQFNEKNVCPFGLREKEIPQHILIAGRSGSGKSNTMLVLAKQFVEKKKPFLIFSFKREYRSLLGCADSEANILAFTAGRNVAGFGFNPLIIPKGTDRNTWINIIAEAISSVYFLGEGSISVIRRGLSYVYSHYPDPKIKHLKQWLEDLDHKQRRELDWLSSTKRAVDAMCFGAIDLVLNSDSPIDIEKLLTGQTILELDNFNDDDRTFIIQCLMRWIYRYALENYPRNDCKFVLMIDEAHHVFLKKQSDLSGKETYSDAILRMVRECSVGFVLGDQHPSLISLPALGNTFTTIAMNLKTNQDARAIGDAMLLDVDQRNYLGKLPVGFAIVKLQDRYVAPFLIRIPKVDLPDVPVSDEQLRSYMKDKLVTVSRVSTVSMENCSSKEGIHGFHSEDEYRKPEKVESVENVSKSELSRLQHDFLVNVLQEQFIGTSSRYRKMQISTRHGNSVKDSLVQKSYLQPVMIHVHHNTIMLFEFTEKALRYFREREITVIKNPREGSIEHRFGIHYVKQFYEQRGFKIEVEKQTASGKFVDLVATKGKHIIANEIETGKSDVLRNVEAAFEDGYKHLCVIATNYEALQKIKSECAAFQTNDGTLEISYLLPYIVTK